MLPGSLASCAEALTLGMASTTVGTLQPLRDRRRFRVADARPDSSPFSGPLGPSVDRVPHRLARRSSRSMPADCGRATVGCSDPLVAEPVEQRARPQNFGARSSPAPVLKTRRG